MSDHQPSAAPSVQPALAGAIQAIATSIVDALAEPLRAEIEARVQQLVAEATRDIHARIVTAVGQIQPINIPINLFAQPLAQLVPSPVVPQPQPEAAPSVESVPSVAPAPVTAVPVVDASIRQAVPAPLLPAAVAAPVPFAPTPVAAWVADLVATTPPPPPAVPLPPTPTKKKQQAKSKNLAVTVVGLKPGQAHMIKTEFRFLKLTFVPSDARNSSQLTALSKSDNTVLFMTDFISHSSVETVRSANGHWHNVTGGMTSLREKLYELYQVHQQAHVGGA